MMTTKATTAAATTATTVTSMDASSMAPDRSLIIVIAILASIVVVTTLIVFISLVSYVVYRRKVAVRNDTASGHLYEAPAEVIVDHFNMSNSPAYSIPDVMTQNSAYTVTADNETYEDVI